MGFCVWRTIRRTFVSATAALLLSPLAAIVAIKPSPPGKLLLHPLVTDQRQQRTGAFDLGAVGRRRDRSSRLLNCPQDLRGRAILVLLVGRNLLESQFLLVAGFLPGLLGRFRVAGGMAGPGEMVQPQARGPVADRAAQFGHGLVEAACRQNRHAPRVEILGIRSGKLDRPIGEFQARRTSSSRTARK